MSRPRNRVPTKSFNSAVQDLNRALDILSLSLLDESIGLEGVRTLKRVEARFKEVFAAAYASNQQTGRFLR